MSTKFDEKKVSDLWTQLVEAEGRLRSATKQLASSPTSALKQKWEVEYDNFSEFREAYEEYMEDLADSIKVPNAG